MDVLNGERQGARGNADFDKTELCLRYQSRKEVAASGLLGFFVGLAVIVPGVSGSTVAIIFRLYEKLLYAIGNLPRKFKACLLFLLPIAAGAAIGFALGFIGVKRLLNLIPFAIVALFAGLMLGAFASITDQLKGAKPTAARVALFAAGLLIPVFIAASSAALATEQIDLCGLQVWQYLLVIALGFAVAVTQLVPGLSATALLMMVGCFAPVINSVSLTYWRANPQILIVYAALGIGFLAGLLAVSRFLSGLFERRREPAFFAIAGLSLGSIVSMFLNSEIIAVYHGWAKSGGMLRDLSFGGILFAAGVAASYGLVCYERKKQL